MDKIKRDPGLAAVFSFIFSGLGQIYNGQILKGLAIISVSSLNLFIFITGSILLGLWLLGEIVFIKALILGLGLCLMGLVSICLLGVYSIFDAYRTAGRE